MECVVQQSRHAHPHAHCGVLCTRHQQRRIGVELNVADGLFVCEGVEVLAPSGGPQIDNGPDDNADAAAAVAVDELHETHGFPPLARCRLY